MKRVFEALQVLSSFIWKHLDNMILIGAGILFTIGGYVGALGSFLGLPTSLGPLIVGMLAILAISQIRSRDAVSRAISTWRSKRTDLFETAFPQEYLDAQSKVSHSYFYSDTTMQRTITSMREHLKRILSGGGKVRILLPDPDNQTLLELIAKTHPDKTAASIGDDIRNAIRITHELRRSYENIALRTIDFSPSLGINALDAEMSAGMIMIQMYEFKATAERAPIFILKKDDGPWFEHFTEQIDRLWKSGTDYPLNGSRSPTSIGTSSPGL